MIRPDELDLEYVKETCKIGQGADCRRYLTMGAKGWPTDALFGRGYCVSLDHDPGCIQILHEHMLEPQT